MRKQILIGILASTALGVAGAVGGLIAGAFIGGNWASNFELFGVRGYEAVGRLGLYLGGALGVLAGAYWARR